MEETVHSGELGEQASIDELWVTLRRDIRRHGVDHHLADDVLQETWLRMRKRAPHGNRSLRPWLLVVGLRVLAQLRRQDQSRLALERRVARRDVAEIAASREEDSRVLKLVAGLPDPYREIVTLRYVEDLEVEEIARRLERSQGTIRSQLKRGLDRLRHRLDADDGRDRGARRPALSLLPWLRSLIGREERAWIPVLAGLGIAGGLGLLAFLARGRGDAEPEARVVVAGLPTVDAGQASSVVPFRTSVREPAGASGSSGAVESFAGASPPPRSVSGTVRHPDGSPAAGASVWKGRGNGRGLEIVAHADAAGRFAVEAVEFERFLWATLPGWLPSRRSHPGTQRDGRPAEFVLTTPRGRLQLLLCEEGGQRLGGVEVELDWSLDHPATALFSAEGELCYESEFQCGTTDALGRLELPVPRASSGQLRVRIPGRTDRVESLAFSEGDTKLELVLPRAAHLSGTVVDARGEPVPGASIDVRRSGGSDTTRIATGSTGTFELAIDPGEFELWAHEASRGRRSRPAQGVLEPDGRRILDLVLEDEPEGLRGWATAAGGPLAGALVLCRLAGSSDAPIRTYTDSRGRFAFADRVRGETVDLELYGPAWDLLCERDSVQVGGEELVLSSMLDPSPQRIVLEFECEDPSLLPTVVELHSKVLLDKARVFPVDAATRTCTLLAPRSSAFEVLPWVPGLGAWRAASTELAAGGLQRLRIPTPARVRFQVDLPPGIPRDAVRGGMRVPGMMSRWVASPAGLFSFQELRLDSSSGVQVRAFPGTYPYFFDGPGLAHAAGVLRLGEAASVSEVVRMDRGVEARVIVRFPARALPPVLCVRTPEGRRPLEGSPVEIAGSLATFLVGLPQDALSLEASVNGLSGSRVFLPGELASRADALELTIELAPLEAPDTR